MNALVGLWARNMNLIYTMRTSNHQFDGSGCQHRELLILDAAGGMHWDHIYVTKLLSNRSCQPVHDFVISEYVAVSRIRDALATVPSRYLKAVKTDCVVFQDLPKKFQSAKNTPTARPCTDARRSRASKASTESPESRRSACATLTPGRSRRTRCSTASRAGACC